MGRLTQNQHACTDKSALRTHALDNCMVMQAMQWLTLAGCCAQ